MSFYVGAIGKPKDILVKGRGIRRRNKERKRRKRQRQQNLSEEEVEMKEKHLQEISPR